ncbi:DUF2570 domain-containing protein [Dickeya poaceiphila]|uniref:DUF2570 domain-containing protein n=1 Tax=Dickeya poaceiphila TaxID=568768 RepID=A0A5B8I4N0_9GAMM|nr:DUF2570 domain-containing protein [Dickeya poaceiphila]QDX29594.1 DUF2570 domain-containing protein [Dickeya poaceiphila]
MKLTATLAVLLVLAVSGVLWQTYQRGIDRAHTEALTDSAQQQRELLTEFRALADDARNVLAQVREREQQRYAEGEERREKMREGMQPDTCANTVVPVAVSDSLQKRAAVQRADTARPGTAQPDGTHTDARTENTGDLGRGRALE